jgi:hypothetical protein
MPTTKQASDRARDEIKNSLLDTAEAIDLLRVCQEKECGAKLEAVREVRRRLQKQLMESVQTNKTEAGFDAATADMTARLKKSKEFKAFQKCYLKSCSARLDALLPRLLKTLELECQNMGDKESCARRDRLRASRTRAAKVNVVGHMLQ